VAIEVTSDLSVILRLPQRYPEKEIPALLERHSAWIEKAVAKRMHNNAVHPMPDEQTAKELIQKANDILPGKVQYYSAMTGLVPSGMRITSAKKRFGSCSGRNSVCFSYLLMQYPDACIDYVVLHELCHIKHHNHSKDFYELIKKYMPDYREREKLLKS